MIGYLCVLLQLLQTLKLLQQQQQQLQQQSQQLQQQTQQLTPQQQQQLLLRRQQLQQVSFACMLFNWSSTVSMIPTIKSQKQNKRTSGLVNVIEVSVGIWLLGFLVTEYTHRNRVLLL